MNRQNALSRVVLLAVLSMATVLLAALIIDPPTADLVRLAIFLPVSGGASLVLGAGFLSVYRGRRLRGIRGKMIVAVLLSASLILINVAFTAWLMFLSSHDLKLLTLLLLFSLGIAGAFAFTVADAFQATLRTLVEGVQRLGDGHLETRLDVRTGDELEDLATAFNAMAMQLDESFMRQHDLEEARHQLIASVSHDLRTPLATLRAMVESINDGVVSDGATVERYHHTMKTEIDYLSRLIDDLFELSQIDSGLLELRPEIGSVTDLVSGTLESLRPQAEQRRLILHGEVEGLLPNVLMDMPRLQRVLYNLVQNALRHTPPDGSIIIRAVDAGEEVEISVRDTGEGVETDDLPHIFDRFYRASRARSRTEAGSGLGLTIAKGIIELHGGHIWASSERGTGATFVFTLPKSRSAELA